MHQEKIEQVNELTQDTDELIGFLDALNSDDRQVLINAIHNKYASVSLPDDDELFGKDLRKRTIDAVVDIYLTYKKLPACTERGMYLLYLIKGRAALEMVNIFYATYLQLKDKRG